MAGERGMGGRAGLGREHSLYVLSITGGCFLLKIVLPRVPTRPLGDNWFQAVSVDSSARSNGITYASGQQGGRESELCAWNTPGK